MILLTDTIPTKYSWLFEDSTVKGLADKYQLMRRMRRLPGAIYNFEQFVKAHNSEQKIITDWPNNLAIEE